MLRAGGGGWGGQVGSSSDCRSLGSQRGALAVSWDGKKGGVRSEVGTELGPNVRWYLDVLYSAESDL